MHRRDPETYERRPSDVRTIRAASLAIRGSRTAQRMFAAIGDESGVSAAYAGAVPALWARGDALARRGAVERDLPFDTRDAILRRGINDLRRGAARLDPEDSRRQEIHLDAARALGDLADNRHQAANLETPGARLEELSAHQQGAAENLQAGRPGVAREMQEQIVRELRLYRGG
jgi:hypothetical protein